MKVFKLSHALISGGVSFQKFGARTIKDLAASAVVVTGISHSGQNIPKTHRKPFMLTILQILPPGRNQEIFEHLFIKQI